MSPINKNMDHKEIIDKAINGEDVAELTKDFTEEQTHEFNVNLRKAVNEAKEKDLEALKALRLEKKRVAEKASDNDAVVKQFREEQVGKAKEKFFSDARFPLTTEQKAEFEENFKRLDTGKVDADLIFKDLTRIYAYMNGDSLLSSQEKLKDMEKQAQEFNAQGAFGSSGSPSGDGDDSKYSDSAKALYKAWQKAGYGPTYTLDKAQRVVDRT